MNFKIKYPKLYQFLAGYFPDADFENLTDEQVVLNYINDCVKSEASKKDLNQTRKEISEVDKDIEIIWEEIGDSANLFFENSTQARSWMNDIRNVFEKIS